MPNWKKVLTSGSAGELASLYAPSITGSLLGTASWANNAVTASYFSGSITNAVSSSYAVTASYAETASFSLATTENRILVLNQSGYTINKGIVVHITASGTSSDIPRIISASYESDEFSANTLGIARETITNGSQGFVTTEGVLTGLDTSAYTSGQLIYLGIAGSITGSAPRAPLHAVRLGQVIREQSVNGSIYVRIDNGYELEELHNVVDNTTTGSYGDLLMKSGSVWVNSKQLTGSYGITGSLTVSGSTSVLGTLDASGFQFIRQYNGTGNFLSGSLAIGKAAAANTTLDVSGSAIITGSLDVTQALNVAGNTTITNGLVRIQGNSSNELVRITQLGTGNAFVVEDSTNPDATPFVVDAAGNVGIGTASPTRKLHTSGSIPLFEGSADAETRFLTFKRSDSSAESFINYTGVDLAFGTNGRERLRIGRYGEIAIGITSSAAGARVYITGNDEAGNESGVNPRTTPLLIASASSNTDLVRFTQTGTGNSFVVEDTNTPDSSKFVIDGTGNVGIGSSIPNSKLEINGNTIITGSLTVSDGGVKGITLNMDTSVGNSQRSARLLFSQQDSTKSTAIYATSGSMVFATSASYNSTSGLTRMFISESGDIGIGTSTPTAKLDVVGNIHISYTGSNNHTISQTNGNFGYGKITPFNSNGQFVFDTYATSSIASSGYSFQYSGSSVLMFMSSSGNIGIGTSAPNAKLAVLGNTNITGSLNVTAGITGSLLGTSSFAITASNATGLSTLNQNVVISGSLTITNDISVLGSASIQYITSSQLNIFDNIISVNTFTPSVRFGGIAVNDSGSTPIRSGSLLFDSQNNQWIFVHQNTPGGAVTSSMLLMGPQTFNNVGNETALTANRLTKASGADLGEHLTDSNIEDTGTTVTITGADASYSSNIITQPSSISATTENTGTGLYSQIRADQDLIILGLYDAGDISRGSITITPNIVSITGSLDVKSGITGSLFGTASWANNAITASYTRTASTASFINVTNTNNASDYYIVGIDSDNGAQNPEQLYNFGTLAFNPDSNTLKVANGAGIIQAASLIGTASYATTASYALNAAAAAVPFPYTGSAQITGSLGVTGSFSVSEYDATVGLYNVVDTSAKRIQVVWPDSSIAPVIDWNSEVLYAYDYNGGSYYVTVDWNNRTLNTIATSGVQIQKTSVDWGNRYLRYANTGLSTPPISVDWGTGFLVDSSARNSIAWNTRRLIDTSGSTALNWQTPGTLTVSASMVLSASVTASSGNSATSDALLQATLLYLSNNF